MKALLSATFRCSPTHIEDELSPLFLNHLVAFNIAFFAFLDKAMANNAFTGAKEFGTISDNQGVIIGDVSGYPNIIGSSFVHVDIDFMLNFIQGLRPLFMIRASHY